MKLLAADGDLTVRFEPSGQEISVSSGDYITVVWENDPDYVAIDEDIAATGLIEHAPHEVVVCAPHRCRQRAYSSDNTEIDA
jgi:predicted transcriptional regulator of viral defense system